MQERHGIAEVFHTFPKKFKQDFKGRGHEVGHQILDNLSAVTVQRTTSKLSSRNMLTSGR